MRRRADEDFITGRIAERFHVVDIESDGDESILIGCAEISDSCGKTSSTEPNLQYAQEGSQTFIRIPPQLSPSCTSTQKLTCIRAPGSFENRALARTKLNWAICSAIG
jgi:hypothetical protein